MISIRHIGIYVNDLEKMTEFYQSVFNMSKICIKEKDSGDMINQLLKHDGLQICVSKLITEYGKQKGNGDMLELIKVLDNHIKKLPYEREIFPAGMCHIAFEVDDIEATIQKIQDLNGEPKTSIYIRNKNKCCFAKDVEGNWIELIERHK